ncbi:hypothetical protein IWW36_000069 [Coemansia brasiliensis]|uniref:BHLH domain-containing protein n=1 Tax=Coemansia brasiliensis TaxID=2650707 RepID=A0A9W8IE99_9FUNG|nr:hypothetical protein IWW36_000069 [Coemansia brasiliensis]
MDRRVSLPSFHEIAGALPKSGPFSASAPQPIPYENAARKSPAVPLRHQNLPDSAYSSISVNNSSPHYALGSKPAAYEKQYEPPPMPQPHSYPTPQPYPQQPPSHFTSISPPLHPHIPPESAPGRGPKESYRISAYEGCQPQVHGNNVHIAAQMTGSSMERPAVAAASLASSLPHQPASFMHPPLSSRYAPYHMPGAPPLTTTAALPLSSPAAAATRISPSLSPTYRYSRSSATDSVSRGAASSLVAQRRHSANNASAAQIPHHTSPRTSTVGSAGSRHSTTSLRHLRERPAAGLIEEQNEEEEDNESIGYDEMHQGSDKAAAEDPMMNSVKIRTIHKLAERRRRREMKNLFDTLRKCLPIDKTIRLSKWEVLKKAIEVISAQDAEIHMLRLHIDSAKTLPSNHPQ